MSATAQNDPAATIAEKLPEPVVMPTLLGVGSGNYNAEPTHFFISFLTHILMVILIVGSTKYFVDNAPKIKQTVVELIDPGSIALPPSADQSGGGGGGG